MGYKYDICSVGEAPHPQPADRKNWHLPLWQGNCTSLSDFWPRPPVFQTIQCTYTILNLGVCLVWFAIVLPVALSVTSMWKLTASVPWPWPPLNPRFRQVTTRLCRVWFLTPQPDGGSGGPVKNQHCSCTLFRMSFLFLLNLFTPKNIDCSFNMLFSAHVRYKN